jgi:aspartate carbamoyltransferase catalytic subunit
MEFLFDNITRITDARPNDTPKEIIAHDAPAIAPEISVMGTDRIEKERTNEPVTFNSEKEAVAYLKNIESRQSDDFIMHQVKYATGRAESDKLTFKYDKKLRSINLRSP